MHNYLLSDNFDKSTNITKATLSKDERYAILTGEFKNIAHIASMNQESFELVEGKLENISRVNRKFWKTIGEYRDRHINTKSESCKM